MRARGAQLLLALSLVLFGTFFANVVTGALSQKVFLSDVGELLLLLACSICFVAATLLFEAKNKITGQ